MTDVHNRAKIIGAIVGAARREQLLRLDGRRDPAVGVAEAQHVRGLSQRGLRVAI